MTNIINDHAKQRKENYFWAFPFFLQLWISMFNKYNISKLNALLFFFKPNFKIYFISTQTVAQNAIEI